MLTRSFVVLVFALAGSAEAHFWLETPAASYVQNQPYGDPQKQVPCGGDGVGTPTNMVTTVTAGELLTIRVRETITHPGHYYVALGLTGPSSLPAHPPVTVGSTDCGSVPIMNPPVFPVIADGQLVHTSAFSGPQTFQVRIPSNVSCTNCTLQVVEWMAQHGAPCFYYHCANLRILAADAGTAGGGSAGGGSAGGGSAGGGSAGGGSAGGSAAGGSAGGSPAGGSAAGGSTSGGSAAGGSTSGGSAAGGSTSGGSTSGGSAAGGATGGSGVGGGTSSADAGTDPGPAVGCGCTAGSGALMAVLTAMMVWLGRRRS